MKINIKGKNLKLTSAISDYAEQKIRKLEKYLQGVEPINIDVELHSSGKSKGQPRVTAEVTLQIPGTLVRVEELAADMYEAIDLVEEKLERKLGDAKKRFLADRKKVGRDDVLGFNFYEAKSLKKIVKRKKFDLGSPISEEDAVVRMGLLGHDFYLFIDKKDSKQKVIYKREDGGYGVIQGK